MANPMTTAGDLIRGGTAGAPTRVAVGTTGQVLTVAAGVPVWADAGGGIDTSLQLAPDTGWTAKGGGTASITGGVATFINNNGTVNARLHRTLPLSSPHAPMIEAMCRCTLVTSNGSMQQGIGVTNGDFTRGVYVVIDGANYNIWYNISGSWTYGGVDVNSGGDTDWLAGTVWLRLVVTDSYAHFYYAIAAGPTAPTSWTRIGSIRMADASPDFAEALSAGLTDLVVFSTRAGGVSADEMTAEDIQWRSLLGAPT